MFAPSDGLLFRVITVKFEIPIQSFTNLLDATLIHSIGLQGPRSRWEGARGTCPLNSFKILKSLLRTLKRGSEN